MDFSPSNITENIIDMKNDFRNKLKEIKRVLKITEKPDMEEFKMSAKITGAGMVIIGAIGFVFYLASTLL